MSSDNSWGFGEGSGPSTPVPDYTSTPVMESPPVQEEKSAPARGAKKPARPAKAKPERKLSKKAKAKAQSKSRAKAKGSGAKSDSSSRTHLREVKPIPKPKNAKGKKKGSLDLSSGYDRFEVSGVAKESAQTKRERKEARQVDVVDAAKSFRQLARMLSASRNEIGPIDQMAKRYRGTPLGVIYARMRTDMADNNMSFASAFSKNGRIFPKVVTGLVSIGSQAGREGEALVKAAEVIQNNYRMGRRIKSAISEPIFTLVLTFLFLLVVLFGIIPQFQAVFDALNKPLPFLSQFLMDFSTVFAWVLGIIGAITIGWLIYWRKTGQANEELRVKIDTFKLNMKPKIFGELIQTGAMAQLFGSLAILRGIQMNERNSLIVAARSTPNWALRKDLLIHADRLEAGEVTFGQLADNKGLYPDDAGYMLTSGEDSGRGTQALIEMADDYKIEADIAADQFVAQIGPVANILVGSVYMFVMLASYLPVFEMYTSIGS